MRRFALKVPRTVRYLAASVVAALLGAGNGLGAEEEVTYYRDVRSILRKHCTICHNNQNVDEPETSGGVSLSDPDAILKSAKASLLTTRKPAESTLFARLVTEDADKRMPKDDDPLDEKQIATIRRWIEAGMPLGKPVASGSKRVRRKPRRFRDLTLPTTVTPPKGHFESLKPGKLSLVATVGPLAPVTALAFSPDGKYLAAGSFRRVVVWDLGAGTAAAVLTDPIGMVHDLEFAPDATALWLAGGDSAIQGEIRSYAVPGFESAVVIDQGSDAVIGLAVSPDGTRLAATGFDRQLRIFELPAGKLLHATRAHSDFVYDVAFSADGKNIVTGSRDKQVKLWNVESGKSEQSFSGHGKDVLSVLFAPDGKTIYSTGLEPRIRKWDVAKGGKPTVQGGHGGIVYQMAWDKDRTRFVTGGSDRTVRTWKPDAKPEKTLKGATEVVYSVALSAGGKLAAAGCWDGLVRIWDVESGRLQVTLFSAGRNDEQTPDWLALTAAGFYSASPTLPERARWIMSKKPVPYERLAKILAQPAQVVHAFTGAAPNAVAFPKPDKAERSKTPRNVAKQ